MPTTTTLPQISNLRDGLITVVDEAYREQRDPKAPVREFFRDSPIVQSLSADIAELEEHGRSTPALERLFSDESSIKSLDKKTAVSFLIKTGHVSALRWLVNQKQYQFNKADLYYALHSRDNRSFDLVLERIKEIGFKEEAQNTAYFDRDLLANGATMYSSSFEGYKAYAQKIGFEYAVQKLDVSEDRSFFDKH